MVDDVFVSGNDVIDESDGEEHDFEIPAHATYADAVVALGTQDAGYRQAMGVGGHLVAVVFEIPAEGVVNKAVAIVVDAVAGDFAGVHPDVVAQVFML